MYIHTVVVVVYYGVVVHNIYVMYVHSNHSVRNNVDYSRDSRVAEKHTLPWITYNV
jgi:hypothetical protein